MKKFECNDCPMDCKIEINDDSSCKPTKCIFNGEANWHEVKEEIEVKEEVKGIVTGIPKLDN